MSDIHSPLDERLHGIVMEHLAKLDDYVPGPVRNAGGREKLAAKLSGDPVFGVFGLDGPEYIAATFAGGVITSIHRKLGDIYESVVKAVFMDRFGLPAEGVGYTVGIMSGEREVARTTDVYLDFDRVPKSRRARVRAFGQRELLALTSTPRVRLVGLGLEIRHCYQTGDSKRTQADEAMARHLMLSGILPIMPLFCNQSNPGVVRRYRNVWVVKEGMESYDLINELSGYDLYDFMRRNRGDFREPVINLLRSASR